MIFIRFNGSIFSLGCPNLITRVFVRKTETVQIVVRIWRQFDAVDFVCDSQEKRIHFH